jgi:hypothetical protein
MHRKILKNTRAKLSATISAENLAFLEHMVQSGDASTISEAVDRAIFRARQAENRRRLELATAEYFASLSTPAKREEQELANALHSRTRGIDIDREL